MTSTTSNYLNYLLYKIKTILIRTTPGNSRDHLPGKTAQSKPCNKNIEQN